MIDKLIQKIKRYPFQTGILLGFLMCIILVGFIGLFRDNGRTLAGNSEIIREDYLRMTIGNFGEDRDSELAEWRYSHLGKAANETLKLMAADESISPQLLGSFAKAINKTNVLSGKNTGGISLQQEGTPSSPRKDLSGFGKTILIILGLMVLIAAGLYIASIIKTRNKQKRRAEVNREFSEDTINMITPEKARSMTADEPDTLFDLDSLFPTKDNSAPDKDEKENPSVNIKEVPLFDEDPVLPAEDAEEDAADTDKDEPVKEDPVNDEVIHADNDASEEPNDDEKQDDDKEQDDDEEQDTVETIPETEESSSSENNNDNNDIININNDEDSVSDLEIETSVYHFESPDEEPSDDLQEASDSSGEDQEPEPVIDKQPDLFSENIESNGSENADKPLVETDIITDPNSEDELLQMIRGSKTSSDDLEISDRNEETAAEEDNEQPEDEIPSEESVYEEKNIANDPADTENEPDGILIHYQSSYRIGNDMYDEVFSIDNGDEFRGECGISIGETLNNTEPKAVTAFEVWLFDKDDIHTTTWYLMSDFALSNESISERLLQHGKCERIRKNASYLLETQTLIVEIKVLDVEYGTEMEEKNSYFTNVTFDITARNKNPEDSESDL